MVFLNGRMPEVVQLLFDRFLRNGPEHVAAGMKHHGFIGAVPAFRNENQIYKRIQIHKILAEIQAVQFGHVHREEGDVDLLGSGHGQRFQAAFKTADLLVGIDREYRGLQLFESIPAVFNQQNSHSISPGRRTTLTRWRLLCSRVIVREFGSPTRSISPLDRAASRRGPTLRSAMTSAAKRS